MQQNLTPAQPLVFQDVNFSVIPRDGEPWLRVHQIADAFGYTAARTLNVLYNRNKEEFTSLMTAVVELDTPGGRQPVRIFSLRGAHLLGMFARTDRAKEFRHWVLNILEQYQQPGPAILALPSTIIDKDTELAIKQRATALSNSWYAAYCLQMRHAVKNGQFARELIASWMPQGTNNTAAPVLGLHGEPHSRWTVCYDAEGLPQVKKMPELSRVVDLADFVALSDLITGLRRKYEPPIQRTMPPGN